MYRNERVFRNSLYLDFESDEIQSEYWKKIDSARQIYAVKITVANTILSLITSILNFLYRNYSETLEFEIVKIVSYINTALNLFSLILIIIIKNKYIRKYLLFMGYILLLFSTANFKYPLIVFIYNKSLVIIIFVLLNEILFRLLYSILKVFTIKNYFILNFLEILLVWAYIYPTSDPLITKVTVFFLLCYTFLFSYLTFYIYLLEKQNKTTFYYQFLYEDRYKLLELLIDDIKTGILTIRGNKVFHINNFLQSKLKFISEENLENLDCNSLLIFLI